MTKTAVAQRIAEEFGEDFSGDSDVEAQYLEWFDWAYDMVCAIVRHPENQGFYSFTIPSSSSSEVLFTLDAKVEEVVGVQVVGDYRWPNPGPVVPKEPIELAPLTDQRLIKSKENLAMVEGSKDHPGKPRYWRYRGRPNGTLRIGLWPLVSSTYWGRKVTVATVDRPEDLAAADQVPLSRAAIRLVEHGIRYRAAASEEGLTAAQARQDLIELGLVPFGARFSAPVSGGPGDRAMARGALYLQPGAGAVPAAGLELERAGG